MKISNFGNFARLKTCTYCKTFVSKSITINFTTIGYEEAAAQGIVAGANAGLAAKGRPPLVIGRDEGYIGVLVDDLVTRGTNEPYRMFTSRAEYRLSLRQDNADIRMTKKGIEAGIVGDERIAMLKRREDGINTAMGILESVLLPRTEWAAFGDAFQMRQKDGKHKNAIEVLSMPDITLSQIITIVNEIGVKRENEVWTNFKVDTLVYDTVEAISKYSNYLSRQEEEMARWKKSGAMLLPTDLEYSAQLFPSFSAEELESLNKHRPLTLHAASQLQGLTPHALIYLHSYVSRGKHHIARQANAALAQEKLAEITGIEGAGTDRSEDHSHEPMHPDFSVSPAEAGLEKHFQEIDDVEISQVQEK
jgi:tRNA uridine 5-carboxymethylaminomethyl modification enzyme